MIWAVIGGAGYIGAHVIKALESHHMDAMVIDDLSTGRKDRLPTALPFYQLDMHDRPGLTNLFRRHRVRGVIHLAAKKSVAESSRRPLYYWHENVGGFLAVLNACESTDVGTVILSSSSSVYGQGSAQFVSEDHAALPINPYGHTKLATEHMLSAFGEATGTRWASLRYFNVAGTFMNISPDPDSTTLVPVLLRHLMNQRTPTIFGDDYPTPDGTCVRDYIHVTDLAEAHLAAASYLSADGRSGVFNVGRGEGFSVREVVDTASRVTGIPITPTIAPRRPGDPAQVIGDTNRTLINLRWRARYGLERMVSDEWQALQNTPA